VPDKFEALYEKALAAAKSGKVGIYDYTWPRFYVLTSGYDGHVSYFMAIEENKKGTLHGYTIDWPVGRRVPKAAVTKDIWNPRTTEAGWKLTDPSEIPPQVINKFKDKIDR
jgi:hypothetical protein